MDTFENTVTEDGRNIWAGESLLERTSALYTAQISTKKKPEVYQNLMVQGHDRRSTLHKVEQCS